MMGWAELKNRTNTVWVIKLLFCFTKKLALLILETEMKHWAVSVHMSACFSICCWAVGVRRKNWCSCFLTFKSAYEVVTGVVYTELPRDLDLTDLLEHHISKWADQICTGSNSFEEGKVNSLQSSLPVRIPQEKHKGVTGHLCRVCTGSCATPVPTCQ